ncbi:glycosyltransferase family 2 protein [Tatumella terrea]|uniref:glycosyltransferase family 2 protein n=1 Tax=Tatumella terrea TaxID=419007 RepID=UPI0031DD3AD6
MIKITVCLLTYNSARTLEAVLAPVFQFANQVIVLDSGSNDETLSVCRQYGIEPRYCPYEMHGKQMNNAIALAEHDWVFCLDSDEILDEATITYLRRLKDSPAPLPPEQAWCISRYWYVLGEQVQTIYPVSSPDYPVRLFNRTVARFNDRPVDDEVTGPVLTQIIPGHVRHDTFYSLHEMFSKMNAYTTRLVRFRKIRPSLLRGVISAIGAFFKWYLMSGAWRQGKVGAATGLYATLYSFLKYFKAWYQQTDK